MKIENQKSEVHISSMAEGEVYGFEDTPQAAQVLSSNIYSAHRRCEAVIREVSTNAQDSHQEAGKPNDPIIVHLPTVAEPFLSIKDLGVGLTGEQVSKLLGTFFKSESNKRENANGLYGLGSKSPHAYTSMFVIEAVKDGMKVIKQSYKDNEDRPRMTEISSETTTDPNGVTVIVPVEEADIATFTQEAIKLYSHFNAVPIFVGLDISDRIIAAKQRADRLISHQGQGWAFYRTTDNRDNCAYDEFSAVFNNLNGNSVVMGSISYPLDVETLAKRPWSNLGDTNLNMLKGLVLHLDIATQPVMPDTGREKLQYTQRTCEILCEKIQQVIAYGRDFFTKLGPEQTLWDRRCLITDYHSDDKLLRLSVQRNGQDRLAYSSFAKEVDPAVRMRIMRKNRKGLIEVSTFDDERKRNSISEFKASSLQTVYVRNDRKINRELLDSYLTATKKTLVIIERYHNGKLSSAQIESAMRWMGNPTYITDNDILRNAEAQLEMHREELRKTKISSKLKDVCRAWTEEYRFNSSRRLSAEEVYDILKDFQLRDKPLYYIEMSKDTRIPSATEMFMIVASSLVKRHDNGAFDVLLIPKNVLPILTDFTCLTSLKDVVRDELRNTKGQVYKQMVRHHKIKWLEDMNDGPAKKIQHYKQLIEITWDLSNAPDWQKKVFGTVEGLRARSKLNAMRYQFVEAGLHLPALKAAADEFGKRLLARFERARSLFEDYPLIPMLNMEHLNPKHPDHQQMIASIRQYMLMINNQQAHKVVQMTRRKAI